MIFCDHLLFLHVPKTGGSSIVHYLLEVLPKPVYYTLPADHMAALPPGVTRLEGIAHEALAEARITLERHGRRLEDVPVIVACVRDPYELEVSRYAFLRGDLNGYNHGPQQALALLGDFDLFATCSRPHGRRPLETYFLHDGVVAPKLRVVRLENIETELADCLAAAGLDPGRSSLPHKNRSQHDDFHRYYYTAAAEQAVYEKYKWVFAAGLYRRREAPAESGPSWFEQPDAVERLFDSRALARIECSDAFVRANAWLAGAEIHRHQLRTGARREALERALGYAEKTSSDRLSGRIVAELACCMALGGPSDVNEGIERCTALLNLPLAKRGHGETRLMLAELLGAAGRFEDAHDVCEQVRAQTPEHALGAGSAAGSVALLAGDARAAEARFRRGRPWNPFEFAGDRAEALYQLGRHAEAGRIAEFTELTAPSVDIVAQSRWRRVRAKLLAGEGRFQAAGELAREAVGLAARCEAPNLHADTLVDLAAVLGQGGQREAATHTLTRALALYERKGNLVSSRTTSAVLVRQQALRG